MIEQRTAEWKRQRLGYFTGSCIGKLMTGTKSDKSAFGDTAMSYIYSVASERNLNEKVIEDETIWQMYDEQVSVWSKAIQFGIDWEPEAREMYAKVTGNKVTETGSVEHPTIDFLSASPDGIIETKDGKTGVLEIKCPTPSVFMEYRDTVSGNASLKKAKAAGVKRIRIHDLRHSHISLLIDMGFTALAIADRVGHESIDITYRYAHLFPTRQTEMADKLDFERMGT